MDVLPRQARTSSPRGNRSRGPGGDCDDQRLDRSLELWVAQALANPRVVALSLTAPTAVRAGLLDRERFPGDPVDRIIYASARACNARLATRDEALRRFDPRATIWN